MLKVGLTGGYATGKSFVASELQRLGCHVIHADKLGHEVLEPKGEAYRATIESFGPEILAPDATIDRKRLGARVFASSELLERLNSLVHPAVFRLEAKMLAQIAAKDPDGIAVLEAAILIETGRSRQFDRIILTVCSEEEQISRGMTRDGLSREEVMARLRHQMPADEKRPFANYVIDTGLPKSETAKRVESVYQELQQVGDARQ